MYRKPNESVNTGFFQMNDCLYMTNNYSEEGFIFSPFDNENPSILIPRKESVYLQEYIPIDVFTGEDDEDIMLSSVDGSLKKNHIWLVKKGIIAIEKKQFQKVVLARQEIIELSDFELVKTYMKLLKTYPESMVYVWFHPKVGLWLGATPETLVKIDKNRFETMSLAGTQVFKGAMDVFWGEKEIEEQQLVTDYIVEKLVPIFGEVSIGNLETVKAGSLLHLRTKITGNLKVSDSEKLITCLHPTPAVCGFPKEMAKNFILANESCNREFYTGFLGELSADVTELFVNLRCMQVKDGNVIVYVGGGVTKDSDPKKEWQETVAKAKVMKKVLK